MLHSVRRKHLAVSAVLSALLLVLLGTWVVVSSPLSTPDLRLPEVLKFREDAAKITWENFANLTRSIDLANSTAVFNSIYAALRQSGSDLHPAGVSYFPAVVPKGTLMFHAGNGQIPGSFEWLAMDHEFSLNFGSRRKAYGRRSLSQKRRTPGKRLAGPKGVGIPVGHGGHGGVGFDRSGQMTMMTFRATRDLNKFLYVDGASASKSDTGEMDTQKMISELVGLKSNSTDDGEDNKHGMSERLYAEKICKWGKKYGLDGIIRVEVGFELVLCDFLSDSTELVSNVSVAMVNDMLALPPPTRISSEEGWPLDDNGSLIEEQLTGEQLALLNREDAWEERMRKFDSMCSFDQILAGQVHDKGDKRIRIDYRYMITGINRTYINPDPNNRRLLNDNISLDVELEILKDLESALTVAFDSSKSTDWQQIFDEIVDKFSPLLKGMEHALGSEGVSVKVAAENVTRYTTSFVRRFTDDQQLPWNGEKLGSDRKFAVYQYTRPLKDLKTNADYLIWSAAVRVVTEVVDTIYNIHEWLWPVILSGFHGNTVPDANERLVNSQQRLKGLIKALNWIPLNYRCDHLCEWDEVCYTPSWGPSPLGWSLPDSIEEYFGMHYDPERQRQVIDNELKCMKIDFLL